MKRIILLFLSIITLTVSSVLADELPIREKFNNSKPTYSNKYSVIRFFQDQVYYANKKNMKAFFNLYAPEYTNNDGFNLEVSKNIINSLWKEKSDIKYHNTVNTISFYGDFAIVNVTETSTADVFNESNQKGTLKSCSNITYYLKRAGKSWQIASENVVSEEINMRWGDARCVAMFMEAPHEVLANTEYSAKLYIAPPTGLQAIASISSERISHPQRTQKDVFRKFSADCSLERLLVANSDNTNEYAISTIMFSSANSNKVTGYACLIRRVNVIPQNKFIEVQKNSNEKVKK